MTSLEKELKEVIVEMYQNDIILSKLGNDGTIYCTVRDSSTSVMDRTRLLKWFKSVVSPIGVKYKVVRDEEVSPTLLEAQLSLVDELLVPWIKRFR